jgi:hypothetical protein
MSRNSKKNKKLKTSGDVRIKINNGTVNVTQRVSRRKRRRTLRKKIDPETELKKAASKYVKPLPKSVNLDYLSHRPNKCTASHQICVEWVHEPMVRFINDKCWRDGSWLYTQNVIFNQECHLQFGLEYGCHINVYLDSQEDPQVILFQNTRKAFDAPAHCHREGAYEIVNGGTKKHPIIRKDGKHAFYGVIGPRRHIHPWSLFKRLPHLGYNISRLYQAEENPQLLFTFIADIKPIPHEPEQKFVREGRLARDRFTIPPPRVTELPESAKELAATLN